MCLLYVTETYDKPKKMIFYKAMRVSSDGIPIDMSRTKRQRKVGVTHRPRRIAIYDLYNHRSYISGFHGFVRKSDAESYRDTFEILVRCEGLVDTRGMHVTGVSGKGPVVVARTMKILKIYK